MALSADGKVLFVGGKDIVGLDVTTGKEVARIEAWPLQEPLCVVPPGVPSGVVPSAHVMPPPPPMEVSPDGTRIAMIVVNTETQVFALHVYDLNSGQKVAEHALGWMHQPVLRFSPSGRSVAVWHKSSTTVLVCDTETGRGGRRSL
jgi:hypothetical protein